ncbi:g4364 [Coccomyxa elongata]
MADPRRRMLMGYVSALADLAAPKAALPLLADEHRLAAYEAAIAAALCEQPGANSLYHSSRMHSHSPSVVMEQHEVWWKLSWAGAHVLALGAGSGVLALMAARAGARRVTAVERSRMLFRLARQATPLD